MSDELTLLTDRIEKRMLRGAHLVIAESPYYYNRIIKAAQKCWGEDLDVYHAADVKADVLRQTMESADMFSDGRLIIVKHAESIDKPAELVQVVQNADALPNTLLFIAFDAQKMTTKAKKTKKGDDKKVTSPFPLIPPGNVYHFKKIYANKIPDIIRGYVAEQGYSIEEDALRRMIVKFEDNTDILFQEIDKLLTFIGNKKTITAADADAFDGNYSGTSMYDILAEVRKKNKQKCFEKMVLYFRHAGDTEALSVIAAVYREMVMLARVQKYASLSDDDIARKVGLHPFVFKQSGYRQASRMFSPKTIAQVLKTCAESDSRVKTTESPITVLYDLLAPVWG